MNNSGIGPKGREYLTKIIAASKGVITPRIAADALHVAEQEAGRLLSRWATSGWLKRIKRGVYIPIPLDQSPEQFAVENPWAIITSLYTPGYIGGLSAASHWDLTEQIIETTFYFTPRKSRVFTEDLGGQKVYLTPIKNKDLFGLNVVWQQNIKIYISDPSRTIIDLLNNPTLAGGITPLNDFFVEYLDSEHRDLDKLIDYGCKLENRTVFKRLGLLSELANLDTTYVDRLHEKISTGYSKLDPTLEGNSVISKWNLKISKSWKRIYDRKK